MSLFAIDLAKLTVDDVRAFCEQSIPEGTATEYKSELATTPGPWVAKAVSALANTIGGVLLLGIETEKRDGLEYPRWPSKGLAPDPELRTKIRNWCSARIYPPLSPEIGYATDNSRAFVVVRVQPSLMTPHTMKGGTRIYVRRGDSSDPVDATFEECELLRNRRAKQEELEERAAEDLRARVEWQGERTMSLIVYPRLGREDAVDRRALRPLMAQFAENEWIHSSTIRPYSNGLLYRGQRTKVAISTRGGFGFGRVARDDAPANIRLFELCNLARMAGKGSVIVGAATGFWGRYRGTFAAHGWNGAAISNHDRVIAECADDRIEVSAEWEVAAARESAGIAVTEFAERMAWACGLEDTDGVRAGMRMPMQANCGLWYDQE